MRISCYLVFFLSSRLSDPMIYDIALWIHFVSLRSKMNQTVVARTLSDIWYWFENLLRERNGKLIIPRIPLCICLMNRLIFLALNQGIRKWIRRYSFNYYSLKSKLENKMEPLKPQLKKSGVLSQQRPPSMKKDTH